SNFFSDVTNNPLGHDRHVDDLFTDLGTSEISAGDHRLNTGQSRGFGDSDFFYARMGNGTAKYFCPKHPPQRDVVSVNRRAVNFLLSLDLRTRNTNGAHVVHVSSPHDLLDDNEIIRSDFFAYFHSPLDICNCGVVRLSSNRIYDLW